MRRVSIGQYQFDLHPLGQAMDAAFDRLYREGFAGALTQLDGGFKHAAREYFDSKDITDTGAHDHFFYGFSPLWIYYRSVWRVDWADEIWRIALEPALDWERAHVGKRIDKGVPYYFWAMTALLIGNIDRGYVLAHQAAEEDRRTSSGPKYPDTPAFALVSLNYGKVDQAFKWWVEEQAKFLQGFIEDYGKTHGRPFGIDDLRDKFLRNPPSHDAIFLFTYTVTRLKEISEMPTEAKRNPFVGQLQLNLLFDLLLVIDSAIKHKKPRPVMVKHKKPQKDSFIHYAEYLLMQAGHRLTLGDINKQFNADFNATVKAALDGTLKQAGKVLDKLQCDVAVAYGLRNRGAHHIESESVIWNDFDRVQKAVLRTFCATVDYLY
jgi:hypothetical protein